MDEVPCFDCCFCATWASLPCNPWSPEHCRSIPQDTCHILMPRSSPLSPWIERAEIYRGMASTGAQAMPPQPRHPATTSNSSMGRVEQRGPRHQLVTLPQWRAMWGR